MERLRPVSAFGMITTVGPWNDAFRLAVKAIAGSAILIKHCRETIIEQARIEETETGRSSTARIGSKGISISNRKGGSFRQVAKVVAAR